MPHFPKHYDVGPHCHLALWLTKFEREWGDTDLDQEVRLWTLRELFTAPLITQGGVEGVFTMAKRRILQATQAVPKDSAGTPYVTPGKAQAIWKAIDKYEKRTGTLSNESFSYFFLNPPPVNSAEHDLFQELCQEGLYVPPAHSSGDLAAIGLLLVGGVAPPMWDLPFPDPTGGPDKLLGDVGYDVLFTTSAKLLYNRYRSTFDALKSARDEGILRAYQFGAADCPTPDGTVRMVNKTNGKCCGPNGCQDTTVLSYCEMTSTGVCNAMSDDCS